MKKIPIDNPLTHAQEQTGKAWSVAKACDGWESFGTFETTGAFAELDGGYKRHCGPTAITNLLLTMEKKVPFRAGKRLHASRVFSRVAAFGKKKLYYINADLLRFYGGTFNIATKRYVKRACALYDRNDLTVKGPYPAWRNFLMASLDKGNILYTELVLHPLYGNHHLLTYGYRLLQAEDGKQRLYLLCADGWNTQPKYLFERDLMLSKFYAVTSNAANNTAPQEHIT